MHSRVTETQVGKLEVWTLFQARSLTHEESCFLFLNLFEKQDNTLTVSRTSEGIAMLDDLMSVDFHSGTLFFVPNATPFVYSASYNKLSQTE